MSARSNTRPAFVAFTFDPASQMVTKVDLARPRYEVQTRFYGDCWENCWLDEHGNPITYATRAEARAAIADIVADTAHAVAAGHLLDAYFPDEFRIVKVQS